MKLLASWICVFATVSSQVFADNNFSAYRLGNYKQASEALMTKSGQDPVADYYLGRMYLYGYGQLKNTALAIDYFNKSADKGYLPAIDVMAKYSLMHDKNPEQAVRFFKQAASKGDVDAQLFMAAAYLYGVGVSKNADSASHYFIDAARNGSAIAQYALAESFLNSRNASNNKLGVLWLTKAANAGNPKAEVRLGMLYVDGKLVAKDEDKGLALINKAAAQNYLPALLQLGDLALKQNDTTQALDWYTKATNQKNTMAYLHLAHEYLQEKSAIYNAKEGFLWTLRAAQEGSLTGQKELAALYTNGVGVDASPTLAAQWQEKASQEEKKLQPNLAQSQAALWLSNDKTNQLSATSYQIGGIFSAWENPAALKNDIYNQAPKIELVGRQEIFKPQFELTQPNEVPINSYYDFLMSKQDSMPDNQWVYPLYPLNPQMEALEHINSLIVAKSHLPVPYMIADYSTEDKANGDVMDIWMHGADAQVNFMSVFSHMYSRAILGDAEAQFEIGQLFQYGIGVAQNDQAATVFYQNAAEQQHLGAEYNLGLMYLKHAKDAKDYDMALNALTDSAFKGNMAAQYVLARLLRDGKTGPEGQEFIKPDSEQALSMLYLSASNHYGPAEYELAERLAHESNNHLDKQARNNKIALVRELYAGAATRGVAQALVPLAYYNAIDEDKNRQASAFSSASRLASSGDEKAALLLGLMYDRGIGVQEDLGKAVYWYGKSGTNPVSQFILGTYNVEGKSMPKDMDRGLDQLQKAADAQLSYAEFNLAVMQHKDNQEFLPNLIKAYTLGDSHAGIVLADYYLAENPQDNPAIMEQARDIYAGLAAKGDQYAQLKLAYMLESGLGTTPDEQAALRWYTASAEQGNPLSQYLLGQFYQSGVLGEPNYQLAKQWYEKASVNTPKAFVALGFLYETVEDNYKAALDNYEKASQMGDRYGDYNLGLIYEYGKGAPMDSQKAKSLFSDAANKGLKAASNQLATN